MRLGKLIIILNFIFDAFILKPCQKQVVIRKHRLRASVKKGKNYQESMKIVFKCVRRFQQNIIFSMSQYKSISALILGLLLTVAVNTAIPFVSSNPYCPAKGQQTLEITQPVLEAYDTVGSYYDPSTDNTVDVYIKFGDASTNFKVVSYDDQTGEPIKNECNQTKGYKFFSFTDGVLLLTNAAGSTHYACIYKADKKVPQITLNDIQYPQSDGLLSHSDFVPYYYDYTKKTLFVGIRKGTAMNLYYYELAKVFTANKVASAQATNIVVADSSIAGIAGSGKCYNNGLDKVIWCLSSVTNAWVDVSAKFGIDANTGSINLSPFNNYNFVLLTLSADKLGGRAYMVYGATMLASGAVEGNFNLMTSKRAYQSQSDRIGSFVAYSDVAFLWINLGYEGKLRFRLISGGDVIDTGSTMTALSLSGNKMIILYNDRIDYYMLTGPGLGTDSLEIVVSKTYDSAALSGNGVFRLGLPCLCNKMKRFSCYSSTLNCMIIKNAGTACGQRDLPNIP